MKLAINGGEPLRKNLFPHWPVFDAGEVEALREVVHSHVWGRGGTKVKEFEEKFAHYQQTKYGVAVTSGTTGLEVALRAANVGAGDEVIMPAYTFMATTAAALQVSALPVFVDIDQSTYTLDPGRVEDAVTEKTRAIIPVHIGGCPADMDSLMRVAEKHSLMVVEDACQAWGAEWRRRRVGAIGDLGAFSFQSSKNITSGEGGIIVTDNRELYELCWSYHNCGRTLEGSWYQHELLGYNYRMTEFQAALLLVQLSRFDGQTGTRDGNARYLSRELSKIRGVEPLQSSEEVTRHAHHLYIFRYNKDEFEGLPRGEFVEALRAEGIPCASGYAPLHRQRYMLRLAQDPFLSRLYRNRVDYDAVRLTVTERACYEEGVWLFQYMLLGTKEDMDDISNAVAKIKENAEELLD